MYFCSGCGAVKLTPTDVCNTCTITKALKNSQSSRTLPESLGYAGNTKIGFFEGIFLFLFAIIYASPALLVLAGLYYIFG